MSVTTLIACFLIRFTTTSVLQRSNFVMFTKSVFGLLKLAFLESNQNKGFGLQEVNTLLIRE